MNERYIAGFFDGEGNVNRVSIKGKFYYQVRIYQAGERGLMILTKIKDFLGYGSIKPKRDYSGRATMQLWELYITSKKNIKSFRDKVGCFCYLKNFPKDDELRDLRKRFATPNN